MFMSLVWFPLVSFSLTAGVFSQTETETQNELDYNYAPEDVYEEEKVEEEEEEAAEEHEEEEAEEHVEEEAEVVVHAEEEEEEEVPLKPQLVPQGSGGSGVLMGPETQKGLKKHKHFDLYF